MLSSLLRPRRRRQRGQLKQQKQPWPSFDNSQAGLDGSRRQVRHAVADWTETEDNEDDTEGEYNNDPTQEDVPEEEAIEDVEDDEDGDENTPLLPIFSAKYLDSIPVYTLTHAIRLIVLPRVETTLTWDQLRSPQVSQFLVKPMQQQIRTSHFSRATLYALMANCLQFGKEGMGPGNSGTSRTRAMVCELLAMKLLKEYNTRELIDGLSYDWNPLQGSEEATNSAARESETRGRPKPDAARISTLEVAIRAQAKRFLAHPRVVQQLESIWAGTIVFHSVADQLHRVQPNLLPQPQGYGGTDQNRVPHSSNKAYQSSIADPIPVSVPTRRTVTLYDPREASFCKLSRLRVPRYRQFFSTCSLAILLGLFLAVLIQKSVDITLLEIVFWLWSAGFMLDEIVGFNEQGLSLYIMSFWNIFDLGILLLLIIFYSMRLYSIFLLDTGKRQWNSMAYDVLATNAVLLFPRLFSILDHYRYFSQLLIAFRLMAVDLAAVFVLIIISCSGFFVAFTLSFGKNEYDAAGVAYGLFQILMGFTPAAWQAWDAYNILGRAILTLFLFIAHFLIVTILITVLTNSFLAIVANANDEHQFLFAVNTISMVKNDALFSYVAPSNLLAWLFSPLRYLMPFRTFVKFNRYAIKITHFPLLFAIFIYEKLFLARTVYEPTDLIENRYRGRPRVLSFLDPKSKEGLYGPNKRVRQESADGFQKDRALEEVFRLTPKGGWRHTMGGHERRQTSNEVRNWMEQHEGIARSPPEQDRTIVDRLEGKRRGLRRSSFMKRGPLREDVSVAKSAVSDPADIMSGGVGTYRGAGRSQSFTDIPTIAVSDVAQTEDDGDDELVTNDEDDNMTFERRSRSNIQESPGHEESYFHMPKASGLSATFLPSSVTSSLHSPKLEPQTTLKPRTTNRMHGRTISTTTVLFNPLHSPGKLTDSPSPPKPRSSSAKHTPSGSGTRTPIKRGSHTPTAKSRPSFPIASAPAYTPVMRRRASSLDLISSTGDINMGGVVPASFATQMEMAAVAEKTQGMDRMMGRLMLARMRTLEESFRDVVREMREMRTGRDDSADSVEEKRKGKRAVRRRSRNIRRSGSVGVGKEKPVDDEVPEGLMTKGNSF